MGASIGIAGAGKHLGTLGGFVTLRDGNKLGLSSIETYVE
jgi:hypothetical protein